MLEGLSDSLTKTMKKLAGMSIIDKKTLKEVTKDIQRALIQSDVNVKVVFALTGASVRALCSICAGHSAPLG